MRQDELGGIAVISSQSGSLTTIAFTCCFDIPGSECNWGGLISQRAPWSTIFAHDERTLCQKTQRLISNDEHDIYRKVWSLFLSLVFSLKGLWVLKQNFVNSISNNEWRTNTFSLLFPFFSYFFLTFPYLFLLFPTSSLLFPTSYHFSYWPFLNPNLSPFLASNISNLAPLFATMIWTW